LGEPTEVLAIKGSGADMAAIEPAGLPAVRLERLRKLRSRAALADTDMVRILRECLIDPLAPNPSVESSRMPSCRTSSSITPMPRRC